MYSAISKKTLILIPAYNESLYIKKVIKGCKKFFKNIIIIDDGSKDKTSEIVGEFDDVQIIKHCINCGQGTAISTGIQFFLNNTNLEYLITIDADSQHDPSDAFKMLEYAFKNNYDVVLGSRFLANKNNIVPIRRGFTLKLAILFERLFYGFQLTDAHNGLRVLSRKACKNLNYLYASGMAHATEIPLRLFKSGYYLNEYPCKVNYNLNKKSTTMISSLNIVSDLIQRK
tara:strand:+ start:997 stop:1683 length:687 start_codon:yes stop_codon:yes gene_type:complete